jgi:hypothetical protein
MKYLRLLLWPALALFLYAAWVHHPHEPGSGNPRTDLESSSEQVREDAAAILRSRPFLASPRDKWNEVMASLQPGLTKSEVMDILTPFHPQGLGGKGNFAGEFENYQLDDAWIIGLHYTHSGGGILIDTSLHPRIRLVPPKQRPDHYSGRWTTFYADGQPAYETDYDNGVETNSVFHSHD